MDHMKINGCSTNIPVIISKHVHFSNNKWGKSKETNRFVQSTNRLCVYRLLSNLSLYHTCQDIY